MAGRVDVAVVAKALLTSAAFVPARLPAGDGPPEIAAFCSRPIGLGTSRYPILIETLKLFVYPRTFDTADILTGMAGDISGLATRVAAVNVDPGSVGGQPAARASATKYSVVGLDWGRLHSNWRPFDFSERTGELHDRRG